MRGRAIGAMLLLAARAAPDATYTYPPQARAIPALRARFDREAAALRREVASERADAVKQDGPTSNCCSAEYEWRVVTDLPRFLSLSQTQSSYGGGAHGNEEFDSLLWDKMAGVERAPLTLFASKAAFRAATREPFCQRLDAERRRRRADTGGMIEPFERCTGPMGAILLGSAHHVAFDRIGFRIAPYDAGPYSDGDYEVTIPVTPAIIAAVRPAWRRWFVIGTS